jgi:hypothetical protein
VRGNSNAAIQLFECIVHKAINLYNGGSGNTEARDDVYFVGYTMKH